MITNERQYRITKAQFSRLNDAAAAFSIDEAAKRTGSRLLAKAELEALKSEVEVLAAQLKEYEGLKAGRVTTLRANSLRELPGLLIRARIARGLSQGQLAARLGLKEQQIQRYESEAYATASLRRLTEVAEALGLNVIEVAEFQQESAGQGPSSEQNVA
jgi:HTH-type transcriptional regulator/antitoxin HigA